MDTLDVIRKALAAQLDALASIAGRTGERHVDAADLLFSAEGWLSPRLLLRSRFVIAPASPWLLSLPLFSVSLSLCLALSPALCLSLYLALPLSLSPSPSPSAAAIH